MIIKRYFLIFLIYFDFDLKYAAFAMSVKDNSKKYEMYISDI